jgi:hypothetical protein
MPATTQHRPPASVLNAGALDAVGLGGVVVIAPRPSERGG